MGKIEIVEKINGVKSFDRFLVTAQKSVEIKKNSQPYQGMEWPLF